MKIFVIGTRGIPDIPGGVEKHCQELYPRIVGLGHEVIICTRASYIKQKKSWFKGVCVSSMCSRRASNASRQLSIHWRA